MNDAVKRINQMHNEERFSRKSVDKKIREWFLSFPELKAAVKYGVELVEELVNGDYYASKNARMAQLKVMELENIVMEVFIHISYCLVSEPFTGVTGALASRLKFSDQADAIKTVAEVVAVLNETGVFDIEKKDRFASLTVISNLELPVSILEAMEQSKYLPPMVCTPERLENNYSSGYLTQKDSLILGAGNHHDGEICLDVLNAMNSVSLKLDTEFLCKVEEEATYEFESVDQHDTWINFKKQSYQMYSRMVSDGNQFYFTHKVDKRGRIYAQGYHINTQGAAFKKAMLELTYEEEVTM